MTALQPSQDELRQQYLFSHGKLEAGVFIHSFMCVYVIINFFLDSYFNENFKGYFVVLQNICKNALGLPYINYNYTLIVQLQWNLTSFHLEMLYYLVNCLGRMWL